MRDRFNPVETEDSLKDEINSLLKNLVFTNLNNNRSKVLLPIDENSFNDVPNIIIVPDEKRPIFLKPRGVLVYGLELETDILPIKLTEDIDEVMYDYALLTEKGFRDLPEEERYAHVRANRINLMKRFKSCVNERLIDLSY